MEGSKGSLALARTASRGGAGREYFTMPDGRLRDVTSLEWGFEIRKNRFRLLREDFEAVAGQCGGPERRRRRIY